MNEGYIKNYRDNELRQFVAVYFLIAVASGIFYALSAARVCGGLSALFEMLTIDIFVGAASILVIIFNELWPDEAKTRMVYKKMPSDSIFSDIASGKVDATGFDLEKAKAQFSHLSEATANKQTAEWNLLLRKSKDAGCGNVVEAQRMQLMTRDLCMTTVSLLIMSLLVFFVVLIFFGNFCEAIKAFYIPLGYLIVMYFITRGAARNRANRFVLLVIKNEVQRKTDR